MEPPAGKPGHRPLPRVFDATATSAGTTLLDVGCGSGLAVQTAAGRGARVAGLDASPALLALARQRCPDVDLRVGDLEELPYGDATFDVATSFNAVQYAPDQHRALLELARVVRPGGQVAIATWGRPETCEITTVLAEVAPLMPPPPPRTAPGGPFGCRLQVVWRALSDKQASPSLADEVSCPMTYPDLATAVEGQASPGVMERAARHVGRDTLAAALTRALQPFLRSDGSVQIACTFRYVLARVGSRPVSMTCPPCGEVLTAVDEDALVPLVQRHARDRHGVDLSPAHILAELHGEDHETVQARGV